jgi:ATP adenylyltransferase
MKRLWAPWRMNFVQSHKPGSGCVFCRILKQDTDQKNLVILRTPLAFVILNRYPYTSGHLMVVPNLHLPSLEDLDKETRSGMMELSAHAIVVLRKVYQPEAFNFGANIGAAAGAGIAGHVHLHIVPRWGGDTNFMSTLGETRVLPEELEQTYHRISAAWNNP